MKPALADSISLDQLPRYISNDRYCVQQKLDGHRVLVEILSGTITAFNRAGEPRAAGLPLPILRCLQGTLRDRWVLDGELIGDTYWVFDLLYAMNVVTPQAPAEQRLHVLDEFFAVWQPPECIRLVPRACTTEDKTALIKRVFENGGEGIILRDLTRPYPEGRRTPALLKAKFVSDADCVVMAIKHQGKDNLVLGVYDDGGRLVEVAHCTALAGDGMKARAGDVVTVQYLYMTADRRLYQPTKPRIRDDKPARDCGLDQFRFVNKEVIV